MKLRELYEQQRKVAVAAFGRMNPPTIGHEKLVKKIESFEGDHYVFLSQTQKPKTDPLPFDVKLEFAKKFFPGVNVGHPSVRTPIQMLQMLEQLGYTDVIYVAGSDRVESFKKLFNDYNGKEYNFKSIEVVSAGERDPDADGAEGMSASKMRAAAAENNYEAFAQGVPDPRLAKKMFDAVRTGMGVKDLKPAEQIEDQQINEAVPLVALAMAARIGAPAIGRLLVGTGKFAAKNPVTTAVGATAAANPEAVKNIYNLVSDPSAAAAALAQGAWNTAKDAASGIASIVGNNLKPEAIKALAIASAKYAIPAAGIVALLYGGKKLYDYASSSNDGKASKGNDPKKKSVAEANYGKYWCSTDKKWKYRKGPKQSRGS